MKSWTALAVTWLVSALAFAGCTAADSPGGVSSPPGGGAIRSDDDYVAQGSRLLDRLIETFQRGGTDCNKLAGAIAALATDPAMKSLQTYEKAHAEAKAKFDAASRDKMQAFEEAAGPALTACENHKKFNDAFARLAG